MMGCILCVTLVVSALCAYAFIPNVQRHANEVGTWIRGVFVPAGTLPTAEIANKKIVVQIPAAIVTEPPRKLNGNADEKPASASTPQPQNVVLPSPLFDPKKDYEDWNDCGPATLALDLRYWGWKGDQQTIRVVVKPERQDKNVNIEELAAYVNQSTAGLQAEIRVGGDLATIQKFIAAGFPVIIEESFKLEKPAWPGDDLWASHFLLITGFDGKAARFTAQDVYYGPDRSVSYNDVVNNWQSFNHVYMVVFPLDRLQQIKNLMGSDWSTQVNAERALDALQSQLKMQPDNAFAWFNLGSSLVALDDYQSADSAFKMARQLGLPKRMLRYQFGPFVAAYQTGDLKDLTQLVDFALKITPDSEEAFYWKGLGALKAGDKQGAALFFRKALEANRNFQDAKNALRGINPL